MYGIVIILLFDFKIYKVLKKIIVNGEDRCDDLFSRYVRKDDEFYLNVV